MTSDADERLINDPLGGPILLSSVPEDSEVHMPARERQVLELAARGQTDKEIARSLGITRDTVGTYWRRILTRFGASSRTEVVARASQIQAQQVLGEQHRENARLLEEIQARTALQAKELEQRNLLEALSAASLALLSAESVPDVFRRLLTDILSFSHSESGFIGEVLYDETNQPYLRTFASTDTPWDDSYGLADPVSSGSPVELRCLGTLYGFALSYRTRVISNNVPLDPRGAGYAPLALTLKSFLALPIFQEDELVGLIGLANRPDGYDLNLCDVLAPLAATVGQFIRSIRDRRARDLAEAELRATLTRLNVMFNALDSELLMEDPQRRVLHINQPMVNLFDSRLTPKDLEGWDCREGLQAAAAHFADPDAFVSRVNQILADGMDAAEDWLRFADGRLAYRRFNRVDHGNQNYGFLWSYRMVTCAAEMKRGLVPLLNGIQVPTWLIDPTGIVILANEAADTTGLCPEPVPGGDVGQFCLDHEGVLIAVQSCQIVGIYGAEWMVQMTEDA